MKFSWISMKFSWMFVEFSWISIDFGPPSLQIRHFVAGQEVPDPIRGDQDPAAVLHLPRHDLGLRRDPMPGRDGLSSSENPQVSAIFTPKRWIFHGFPAGFWTSPAVSQAK